jgi:hypothetical protein
MSNNALEAVLGTNERLRRVAPSVRHTVEFWIPGERAKDLPIEGVLRPMVEFFDCAPGLQPERMNDRVVTAEEVEDHLYDLGVTSKLLPSMVNALKALRYTRHELYKLKVADVCRLARAIRAVRRHLGAEDIPPPALRLEREGRHLGCCLS